MDQPPPPPQDPNQPQPPPPPPPAPEAPAGVTPPPPPAGPYAQQPQYPQGTYAGRTLATWAQRVGAALLDALVIGVPIVIVAIAVDQAIGSVLGLVAGLTYFPLLYSREGERNGQTLGKQWMNIRVLREDGQAWTYGPAVVRELLIKNILFGTIGGFFLFIPTLLNYLWPLWDDQNRALHDMLAKTRVVQAS